MTQGDLGWLQHHGTSFFLFPETLDMKDKQFNTGRQNLESPAPGMASVNTHNPGEEPQIHDEKESPSREDADAQERRAREENREE
jgi:hypothetical protein